MPAGGKNRLMQDSNGDARATGNLLLDALSADERDQLLDGAAVRPIEVGDTWRRPGDTVTSVVFPTSGVLSMLADTGDSTLESATVGREGAADVFAAIASRMAPQLLISQVSGQAYEVPVDTFDKVFTSSPRVGKVIYGYIEALLVQTSMSAACIAAHDLSERCARWLLQTHDRVDTDDFDLKQEFLADMLGVRRAVGLDRRRDAAGRRPDLVHAGQDLGRRSRGARRGGLQLLRARQTRVLAARAAGLSATSAA